LGFALLTAIPVLILRALERRDDTSEILGAVTLCLALLTDIPAFILSILGLRDINRSEGRLTGWWLAVAGLLLSCLDSVVLALGAFLLLP
jgi:hypothetical protein